MLKRVTAWLFRMIFRRELDRIQRIAEANEQIVKNNDVDFVESMIVSRDVRATLEVLERLQLLEPK